MCGAAGDQVGCHHGGAGCEVVALAVMDGDGQRHGVLDHGDAGDGERSGGVGPGDVAGSAGVQLDPQPGAVAGHPAGGVVGDLDLVGGAGAVVGNALGAAINTAGPARAAAIVILPSQRSGRGMVVVFTVPPRRGWAAEGVRRLCSAVAAGQPPCPAPDWGGSVGVAFLHRSATSTHGPLLLRPHRRSWPRARPGSHGRRNRRGNSCSPVMNGTPETDCQVCQVIGARGSGV
jgi:hypothetical protein